MLLLVIGLAAVIIAVLVTVFLVMRRRGDDDEPGGRESVRDRFRGRDTRRSTDPRVARKTAGRGAALSRRPAGEPRGYGGPDRGYEAAGFDQSRGYEPSRRGYGDRPARGHDEQRTERIPAARGGARYQDAPEPAAPAGARAPRAATASRRAGVATDTGPGRALYDTGPSADFATTRLHADPDLADSDVFPRVRADIPETDAKGGPRNQGKGRGRPSRGRHDDDDDWPSTEWDKLSDEQYWAELSADKPLATTARTAQSSVPAEAARSGAQPPGSGRAASRPPRAPDAGPEAPGRRQPADHPGRAGGRQAVPRRPDDRDTDPGRPGLADRPGAAAAQATEQLPVRNRRQPAADPVPSSPAPFMPVAAEAGDPALGRLASPGPAGGPPPARAQAPRPPAGQSRTDEDPLTSPSFGRGAASAEDSRSYRTPQRNPGARPAQPASGYPGAADAYSAGYSTSPGGYPAEERDSYPGPARGRDSYPGQPRDSYPGQPRDSYADPASGYETYPGVSGGSRDYPASAGRHGYPAGQADRTDPGAARTDPGTPRTSPGRRRSTAARQAPPPIPGPAGTSASTGYPAPPPAAAPGWGSDRGAAGEAPSAQSGLGNPYGSYVGTTPAAAAPPAAARPAGPAAPASPYQQGQPAASGNSYPGYTTGPAASYPDPYGSGPAGYPASGPQPPGGGRADQRTTWYSAPPEAAAPQPPASAYPYQPDPGYPAAPDYGSQPGHASYPGTPPAGSRDDTRYRSGQTDDPYRPDGYSGYHSRQG